MTILIDRKQPPTPPPLPPKRKPITPVRDVILSRRREKSIQNQKPEEIQEEWVISIKEKMERTFRDGAKTTWDNLCIYRVPHYLLENNRKSYFPQIVSLSPYHRGEQHLVPVEHHKWRAVNMVMKRTNHSIEMYMDAMRELEERARACYEGPLCFSSDEFVEMLVLDGCFVLELFRGSNNDRGFLELGYDCNDPIFAMRGSTHSINQDMVMLENQLPFFVLDRLLELQLGTTNQNGLVAQLAIRFFNPLMPTNTPSTKVKNSLQNDKFFNPVADMDREEFHCLDVIRRSLLQRSLKPEPRLRTRLSLKMPVTEKRQRRLIHSVTYLRLANIKFRRRKTDRFWDIKFKNGCLEIPKLFIHDGSIQKTQLYSDFWKKSYNGGKILLSATDHFFSHWKEDTKQSERDFSGIEVLDPRNSSDCFSLLHHPLVFLPLSELGYEQWRDNLRTST